MGNPVEMSKRHLAVSCGVTSKTVATWCNKIYFNELVALGYYKNQKLFTPAQWCFLKDRLVIVD